MKLYRTQHHNPDANNSGLQLKYHWQGTQSDASACRRELKEKGFKEIETKDIDVPTDKAGLLAWLNANVTGE
jgi:hypothetical protein